MKKFLLLVAVAIMTATGVQAQRSFTPKKALKTQSAQLFNKGTELKLDNKLKIQPEYLDENVARKSRKSRENEYEPNKFLSYYPWSADGKLSAIDLSSAGLESNSTYFLGTYFNTKAVNALAGNKINEIFTWISPGATNVEFQVVDAASREVLWSESAGATYNGGTQGNQLGYTCKDGYVLEADRPVLVGYLANFASNIAFAYYINRAVPANGVVVGWPNDDFESYEGFASSDVFAEGLSLCMYVECYTGGEATLRANDVTMEYIYPNRVKPGKAFDLSFAVTNWGSSPISSLDYTYSIGDQTHNGSVSLNPKEYPILYGDMAMLTTKGIAPETTGDRPVTFEITKVNGVEDEDTLGYSGVDNYSEDGYITVVKNSVRRQVVMEEFTGTWCGWCTRGIVGVEKAKAAFPDNFTAICVHFSSQNATDPYHDASSEGLTNFISGFPTAFLNRTFNFAAYDPYYGYSGDIVKDVSNILENTGCEAAMGVASELNGTNLNLTAVVKPTMDLDPQYYGITFVVTEDNLTAPQTNYYSSAYASQTGLSEEQVPEDLLPMWNQSASYVATLNDVSRYNTGIFGIEGSTEGLDFTEGNQVMYNYSIPRPTVKDPANVHVIAMLIDLVTGEIVNAQSAPLNESAFNTGIETVKNGHNATIELTEGAVNVIANGEVQIFTMDGKLVSNVTVNGSASIPTFGLKGNYVVRVSEAGNVTAKKVQF